jgi:hypothetical protein
MTLIDFLSLKKDVNVTSNLKVYDENSWIRIQDPYQDPDPDPDPFVRGMEPRIHAKMSCIRNTVRNTDYERKKASLFRIRMFLGLPDLFVRRTVPDPNPSFIKKK